MVCAENSLETILEGSEALHDRCISSLGRWHKTPSVAFSYTVLSMESVHPSASAHLPILTANWFSRYVICVAAHYAKFLCGDSQFVLSLSSRTYLHTASDECCRALATRLWVAPFSSTTQLLKSNWPGWAKKQSMDEVTMWYVALARSGESACTGVVELFKHLLCATTHPQFLMLELQVPTGTCL